MSSLRMMNLSCNDIHAEWVGRVCRFRRGVCRGALASGNCCVICNLVLLRLFFTAEREEDWEFDRGINLCLRLLTEVCVCVWVWVSKSPGFILTRPPYFRILMRFCVHIFFFFYFVLQHLKTSTLSSALIHWNWRLPHCSVRPVNFLTLTQNVESSWAHSRSPWSFFFFLSVIFSLLLLSSPLPHSFHPFSCSLSLLFNGFSADE